MPLTKIECDRAACPPDRPLIRVADEKDMYLEVTKAGGKYWRLKFRHGGKEKRLALGVYPAVSLAQARKARDEAREAKLTRAINDANTFELVARQWFDHWKGPKAPAMQTNSREDFHPQERAHAERTKKRGLQRTGSLF